MTSFVVAAPAAANATTDALAQDISSRTRLHPSKEQFLASADVSIVESMVLQFINL